MIHNQYPIPMLMNDHYECTNVGYAPVSDDSPIFAIDCEMCLTHARRHQLARISIVDEDLNVLLDCYVRPEEPVLDYLTCYSGVTKQHLDEATMTIQDVQLFIQHNLPADCILVGHSLNSDLHAMRICHPYVIDTSVIYNMSSHRDIKPSLKALSKFYLSTQIQQGTNGHCSIEDAQSTMSLVQLKLRKGLMFGDLCLANDQRMQRPDKAFISMSEHLEEQLGPEVKVYFDHPDAHSLQRFVSVHSKYSSRLNSMISASFACRRTVCIVVSNQRAYINVNS